MSRELYSRNANVFFEQRVRFRVVQDTKDCCPFTVSCALFVVPGSILLIEIILLWPYVRSVSWPTVPPVICTRYFFTA